MSRELTHLVWIVGDESAHTELDGVGDILVTFDRMGVDTALGRHTQALHELHLAGRGEIEIATLGDDGVDHRGMWHGFQRVMEVDPRKSLTQLPVLHTHALTVENDQRRTELFDQASDLSRLERIDESCTTQCQTPEKQRARPTTSLTLHLRYQTDVITLRQNCHRATIVALTDPTRGAPQAIANGVPSLALGHILHENLLAARLVEGSQIRVQVM